MALTAVAVPLLFYGDIILMIDTTKENFDYISTMAEQMYLSLIGPEYLDIRSISTTWLDKSGDNLTMTIKKD